MNPSLELDHEYTKNEIENIFDTNFGNRIKGITLRRWADGTPYIILFSRATGPYADQMDGNEFLYDGEGTGKDQTYTTANKILAESGTTGRVIYGFRQDVPNGKWRHMGTLRVVDCKYEKKTKYWTYVYTLRKEN
jgi:hypothetical protein